MRSEGGTARGARRALRRIDLDEIQGRVAGVSRRLMAIYALDFAFEPEPYVIEAPRARQIARLGGGSSHRSGVLVHQGDDAVELGLYLDPEDAERRSVVVEETSHLLCLAWHAARDLPVSCLGLELQAEVDRYAVERLSGGDGFSHFRRFAWAPHLTPHERERYRAAHQLGLRFCMALSARHPGRSHTATWLAELRQFYRAGPERKLRAGREALRH